MIEKSHLSALQQASLFLSLFAHSILCKSSPVVLSGRSACRHASLPSRLPSSPSVRPFHCVVSRSHSFTKHRGGKEAGSGCAAPAAAAAAMTGGGSVGGSVVGDYVAGAIAGSANISLGFPADTVKVRLQNRVSPYLGAWHCATSIVRYEGFRALYRGMSPQLVGGALETGVNYAVYQAMLGWTQAPANAGGMGLGDAAAVPLSAATAGVVLSFVLSPAELVKCRLQLGGTERYHSYSGPLDCLRQTVRQEGLRGLMRGLTGTMAREIPGNAIYFSTYRLLRHWAPGKPPEASPAAAAAQQPRSLLSHLADAGSAVVCGGLAGMVMWSVVLPLDTAKTRMQTAYPGSPGDVGVLRQLRLIHREGGLGALYAGLSPTLARAFPANAAQWLAWELCMQQLQRWETNT